MFTTLRNTNPQLEERDCKSHVKALKTKIQDGTVEPKALKQYCLNELDKLALEATAILDTMNSFHSIRDHVGVERIIVQTLMDVVIEGRQDHDLTEFLTSK